MRLEEGINALGLALPPSALARLERFVNLLEKWNRVYNLTAHRTREAMVAYHVFDALSVLPWLAQRHGTGAQIADVGSGAGVPGLILAIARPDWQLLSIEARQKKAAFQRQVAIELELPNVRIEAMRAETVRERCDAVISRAFAALATFVTTAGHLADRLWAMKGSYPSEEIARLPSPWCLRTSYALTVPGIAAARCLLELEKCTSSP